MQITFSYLTYVQVHFTYFYRSDISYSFYSSQSDPIKAASTVVLKKFGSIGI